MRPQAPHIIHPKSLLVFKIMYCLNSANQGTPRIGERFTEESLDGLRDFALCSRVSRWKPRAGAQGAKGGSHEKSKKSRSTSVTLDPGVDRFRASHDSWYAI